MKKELEYSLDKLQTAFMKLEQGVVQAEDELQRDGVIQRFEFTFELVWKTLKVFLSEQGVYTKTPKASLKEAFRLEWLNEENIFLTMLEDRNHLAHIDGKEMAEAIFNRIKEKYVTVIKNLITKLTIEL